MASLNIRDELRAFAEAQAMREGFSSAEAYIETLLGDAKHYAKRANGRNSGVLPPADFDNEQTLEELTAQQGVRPITAFSELRGHFWPDDETADDFIAAVREWRRESAYEISMSFVVVDTDVVSFLFKDDDVRAERYHPHLENKTLVVSFMTMAELYRWMLIRNWGPERRAALEDRLRKFTKHPYSDGLCRTWASVSYSARRNGRPLETADAWVAAVAVFRNVPLITHNADDYRGVDGLTVITEPDRTQQ